MRTALMATTLLMALVLAGPVGAVTGTRGEQPADLAMMATTSISDGQRLTVACQAAPHGAQLRVFAHVRGTSYTGVFGDAAPDRDAYLAFGTRLPAGELVLAWAAWDAADGDCTVEVDGAVVSQRPVPLERALMVPLSSFAGAPPAPGGVSVVDEATYRSHNEGLRIAHFIPGGGSGELEVLGPRGEHYRVRCPGLAEDCPQALYAVDALARGDVQVQYPPDALLPQILHTDHSSGEWEYRIRDRIGYSPGIVLWVVDLPVD